MMLRTLTIFLTLALAASLDVYCQNGQLDPGFKIGLGPDTYYRERSLNEGSVTSMVVQSTGKIVIAGGFNNYNGTYVNNIARLNENGSIDTSFKLAGGPNGEISTMSLQSDDKILVGGSFKQFNCIANNYIARLNADGSLDTSFHTGSGAEFYVEATAIQPDGKLLVGGSFYHFNGATKHNIVRLNANGSIDPSFNSGIYYDPVTVADNVHVIALQKDGKIIVCGNLTTYASPKVITRLNADGSVDEGFNLGAGTSNAVRTVAIQSDGKILIAGIFQYFNNVVRNGIARLNKDGSLDSTNFYLSTPSGYSLQVTSMCLQNNGKIIFAGRYYNFEKPSVNVLFRMDTQGKLDSTFVIGAQTDKIINVITAYGEDKILLGGTFTSYNGTLINRIARLGSSPVTHTDEPGPAQTNVPGIFPNPCAGQFDVYLDQEETFSLVNSYGQTIQTLRLQQGMNKAVSVGAVENGMYFLKGTPGTGLTYKFTVIK